MSRFVKCGELRRTKGNGFEPPLLLAVKNGTLRGDITVTRAMVKDGRLNFPVEIKEVTGNFYCFENQLTSLKGAPQKVGGDFWCQDNKLVSLKGAPQKVGGNFVCYNNSKQFTEEEVRAVCDVKGLVVE